MLRAYADAGLHVRPDAGQAVNLPMPHVPPSSQDETKLLTEWPKLKDSDLRMWLVVGLARFAGLRREEISHCRVGWIEEKNGVVSVFLCDRPEEKWWTKTGKPYRAQVIDSRLASWLLEFARQGPSDSLVVSDPPDDRSRWFERVPQAWIRSVGIVAKKPLHRLRGLYADEIAKLTADAVTARLAGVRAAQANLGHGSEEVTEKHYLTPE